MCYKSIPNVKYYILCNYYKIIIDSDIIPFLNFDHSCLNKQTDKQFSCQFCNTINIIILNWFVGSIGSLS